MVGTTVDDQCAGIELRRQFTRSAVRQRKEDDVVTGEIRGGRLDQGQMGEQRRCGWWAIKGWPAFWNAVTVRTSKSGCSARILRSSPPA